MHKELPSTTLYYTACISTSSTTLHYKVCTQHFPVLLCTTSLAQSTSQYYFVSQSLHKALHSTTLYYKLTWQPAWKPSPRIHGDVAGKPKTRDETRGCSKTSISCETSSNFDSFFTLSNRLECHKVPPLPRKTTWQRAWKPSKRKGFAASPIDTELTTRRRPDDDAVPQSLHKALPSTTLY